MRRIGLAVLVLVACGGPGSKTPETTTTDAGAVDAAPLPQHLVSTLPTDVRNPPPFALGSKHAQVRAHAEWTACHAALHPPADPAKALDALAQACAGVTKMRSTGTSMTGSQTAGGDAGVIGVSVAPRERP